MKHYRAAELLLFASLLCLHFLPNSCDIKQDASIPLESSQAHKLLSADDPSGTADVSTQQEKAQKAKVGLENLLKETVVQPNVEYVNSIQEDKDIKQFSERIENIESPPHASAEKLKSILSDTSSSSHTNEPDLQNVDKSINNQDSPPFSEQPANTIPETEPLMEDMVINTQPKDSLPSEDDPVVISVKSKPSPMLLDAKSKDIPSTAETTKLADETAHQQYDGMPSFDEWKKMMLAEQEKGGQTVQSPSPGKKISSQKRRRNYSSYECGAKIVSSNGEAEGTSRILNELVDEYMLNPCKAKIWFVIELCETVQALQIELANFELFSSCPKDFVVYSSDNFPTRDWVPLGSFTAAEQRVLQSFELKQEGFGKFIKIELQSHYGEEHYCPLSVVRIFGTSMVDEYEEMETLATRVDIPDDELDRLDIPIEDSKSTNIFGSATDAVMNIVKKAAQALGQQQTDDKQSNDSSSDAQNASKSKTCNVLDSTQECSDISESLSSLLMTPSVHQSMFRLLHRCDQCSTPRVRYYSSAQPHCRFFQAALGPVVFQTLCDWFKDNPLAIAHESPAPIKKDVPSGTFIVSPTKSPPPQIMRIPSDSDFTLNKILNETLSLNTQMDKSSTVNETTVSYKANKSASISNKIQLQSSIKPTQTLQNSQSTSYNDSTKLSVPKASVAPTADIVSSIPTKASVAMPEKTSGFMKETISETTGVSSGEYSTTNEVLTEAEEEQINDFLSDPSVAASDDLALDSLPATELPAGLKISDERLIDVRSEGVGKSEPVPSAGLSSAGQKESVFMRMSNRIKALEINMSLSSQYLQELSQRYRRQMDDMQRAFNRTIGTLNDTARKAAEKDLKQQEVLNTLQLQVANLSETIDLLLNERHIVLRQMLETHVCLMIIQVIVMVTIMSLCIRRVNSVAKQSSSVERPAVIFSPSRLSKRRNSADSCSPPIARKVKKRSNSEEVLNTDVLIVEPLPLLLDPTLKAKKRNKKRNKGMQRSASHPAVQKSGGTSLCSENHTHSEGCVTVESRQKLHRVLNHACENCDNNTCTDVKYTSKERKRTSIPLRNLTNGSVVGSAQERPSKSKDKFSIKKFLKLQKRDSI